MIEGAAMVKLNVIREPKSCTLLSAATRVTDRVSSFAAFGSVSVWVKRLKCSNRAALA